MKKLVFIILSVWMILALCAGCVADQPTTPDEEDSVTTSSEVPIKIGHLTYHTGAFGQVGVEFDMATNFTLSLINEKPPLGGEVSVVHKDIGTIGEGEAAKLLLEMEKVDVLFNVAGEYQSYRTWLLNYIKNNSRPLLPSVHAGSQSMSIGGTIEEPIFRGAPQDADQGIAAVQFFYDLGIKNVVVIAVENDGHQAQKEAAIKACKVVGINVLGEFDFPSEQNSYRALVSKIQALNPEGVLCFSMANDGGTIVKNAAEIGMSTTFASGTDWLVKQELTAAAGESAIKQHKGVYCVGFTYAENEAWDYYNQKWAEKKDITGDFDPSFSYSLQFYDLLNVTMLAIKKAGSLEIDNWIDAMHKVTTPGPDKVKVYSYEQGFDALEKGQEIDYDGVSGVFEFGPTGTVSGNFGVYQYTEVNEYTLLSQLDGAKVLELSTIVGD